MKKTLIVVDMQRDFIDGSLGSEDAAKIIKNVKRKIEKYQSEGNEIIFTRDTHQENYLDTREGQYLPVKHCIENTKGWEILDELSIPNAIYINKPNFGYLGWGTYHLQEVELVGVCTDICVISNALIIKAIFPESIVRVDGSCCAGITRQSHEQALAVMKMCQIEVYGE
ncbi:MAG: cysteine hydrolase family protein [Aminipila sp.]